MSNYPVQHTTADAAPHHCTTVRSWPLAVLITYPLLFCSVVLSSLMFYIPEQDCNPLCWCHSQLTSKMTGRQRCYLKDCTCILVVVYSPNRLEPHWLLIHFSLLWCSCNKVFFWSQWQFNVNAKSTLQQLHIETFQWCLLLECSSITGGALVPIW